MKKMILIFTIGPVQSFIAEARKTQDLFKGSRMLGELASVARETARAEDWEIIFPAVGTGAKGMLNKFVALGSGPISKEELQSLGNKIEEKVHEKLLHIWEKGLDDYQLTSFPGLWRERSKEQIRSLIDVSWIFYPLEEEPYFEAYPKAERFLAASKNLTSFEQNPRIGRKCILDGERNVLFYKKQRNEGNKGNEVLFRNKLFHDEALVFDPDSSNGNLPKPSIRIDSSIIDEGEGLSAVGFVKRIGLSTSNSFPPTSRISLGQVFSQASPDLTDEIKDFLKLVRQENQLMYPEALNEERFKKMGLDKGTSEIEGLKKKLSQIIKKARKENLPWPRYYAMLIFDGDNMGTWFSGRDREGKSWLDQNKLMEFQHFLSEKLNHFTAYCRSFLDEGRGQTVYAGGDDFLGFIYLPNLFEVLKEFRVAFQEMVVDTTRSRHSDFGIIENQIPEQGISGGLVVAHFHYPLSEVLKEARSLEKEAKKLPGKGALALGAIRGTGKTDSLVYHWKVKMDKSLPDLLSEITEAFRKNFSDSFFRNLFRRFRVSLTHPDPAMAEKTLRNIKHELKRQLRRSNKMQKNEKESDSEFKERKEAINQQFEQDLISVLQLREHQPQNFLRALAFCEFIHRNIHVHETH